MRCCLRLNKSQQNEVLRAANICLTADTKRNKVLNTLLTVSSWSDELITVAECNKILRERNLEELTLA
jgi:hypothetical protein